MDRPMKPSEIRKILRKKLGRQFASVLAEKAGMSQPWISRHIAGTLRTHEGRKILARAVGVKMCQIFPD